MYTFIFHNKIINIISKSIYCDILRNNYYQLRSLNGFVHNVEDERERAKKAAAAKERE